MPLAVGEPQPEAQQAAPEVAVAQAEQAAPGERMAPPEVLLRAAQEAPQLQAQLLLELVQQAVLVEEQAALMQQEPRPPQAPRSHCCQTTVNRLRAGEGPDEGSRGLYAKIAHTFPTHLDSSDPSS